MAVASSACACSISVFSRGSVADNYYRSKLKSLPAAGLGRSRHRDLQAQPVHAAGDGLVTRGRRCHQSPRALFGGGGGGGSETGSKDKKFISKEEEPEQYWQTADEKSGKGPMSTPLPYIALLGVLSPFIILGIAFANNWIKIPVR